MLYICYCCDSYKKDLYATAKKEKAVEWLITAYQRLLFGKYHPNCQKISLDSDILTPLAEDKEGEIRMVRNNHFGNDICDFGVKFQTEEY